MFNYLCNTKRSFLVVMRRRIVTVPLYYLLFSGILIASLVLFIPALLVDLFLFRINYIRRIGMGIFYSSLVLLIVTFMILLFPVRVIMGIFLKDGEKMIPFYLKKFNYTSIARAFRFLYSVRLNVIGDEDLKKDRSYIFFINHTSYLDPVFAMEVIMWKKKIELRHVLWRGLLLDAAIDIGVSSFEEAVVDPSNKEEYHDDLFQMSRIIAKQKKGHGVAIYPEGGVSNKSGEVSFYKNLNNPKLAGMLHFLEEDESSDIVFVTHRGLSPARYPLNIWNGTLTGKTIDMQFKVIPRNEFPEDIEDREKVLVEEWKAMDEWIGKTNG